MDTVQGEEFNHIVGKYPNQFSGRFIVINTINILMIRSATGIPLGSWEEVGIFVAFKMKVRQAAAA
jgi:hypothetical protein